MTPIINNSIIITIVFVIVQVYCRPMNEGDMISPDELELYLQIFSSPGNTSTPAPTTLEPRNTTVNIGNRNFIQAPCRKGRVRVGMMCRKSFEE